MFLAVNFTIPSSSWQNRARLTMDFHLPYRVVDTWTLTSRAMIIWTSDGGSHNSQC